MAPINWHFNKISFNYSYFSAVSLCFFLAVLYVGSLYVWKRDKHGRDHPTTIKNRFKRVTLVCALALPFLWLISTKSNSWKARNIFIWIGIRFSGIVSASLLPLLLTMILFLGPLHLHYLDGIFQIYKDPNYWFSSFRNLIWLRNHVVAPLSEEFIFRACMLPLLVPTLGENWAVFICPLFFGVAHFHHLHEKITDGADVNHALKESVFQFAYTSVFGAYSAFLFLRTGHLIAPVMVHAFCNHMGFPDFGEIFAHPKPRRFYIMASFVLGLVSWYLLLYPLTNPSLYGNDLYQL